MIRSPLIYSLGRAFDVTPDSCCMRRDKTYKGLYKSTLLRTQMGYQIPCVGFWVFWLLLHSFCFYLNNRQGDWYS
ncbi:hypothetical protein BJX62DRAFT_194791 [Aspergillus germanicus]